MTIHGRNRTLCAAAVFAVAINVALSAASGATIYVDGKLKDNCKGNYSISARDASGKDGDAYKTICEAVDIAKAGDTVIIREGTYNAAASKQENDALWPKNSGTPDKPITFKAKDGEKVVLGDVGEKYPGWGDEIGLSGALITLKGVSNIVVEGLTVRKVTGWVFARDSNHITIRNCAFIDGLHGYKGTMKIIHCSYFKVEGCTLINSGGDSLALELSDHSVIENCTFYNSVHSLVAIRGSNYNVIRGCKFDNPDKGADLTEIYDVKLDKRDPNSLTYEEPAYDSTKYNLWERNFFGYHPSRPNSGGQPQAMEYSAQNGIVRQNVFCNPLDYREPNQPDAKPGGPAVAMRWGGSWEGWAKIKGTGGKMGWIGEGHEAGYVTGNRFFNNTFYGYDNGCVTAPGDNAMKGFMNPPPMQETNPTPQFSKKYEYSDNEFKNNIMLPGKWEAHINWGHYKHVEGKPIAIMMTGLLDGMRFQNNDIYAGPEFGEFQNWLIYFHTSKYPPAMTPEQADKTYPQTFINNIQKDPMFADAAKADFRLKDGSPMIDAGAFLTVAVGAGKDSKELHVKDAGYFYDGFGIPGEKGDMIQIKGQKDAVRVVAIDYKTNTLKLEKAVSWADGDGVALQYAGAAPDVGALENGLAADQIIGPKMTK